MFKNLWNIILNLFGKKIQYDEKEINNNDKYTANYEFTKDINFTAIFSNKLANLTISDSTVDVIGEDKRTELLQDTLKRLNKKLKKVVARELGTGGCLVVPYVANNKIYFNILAQNRLMINKAYGDDIVDCTILADVIHKQYVTYYRWADYVLENGNLTIKYRATNDNAPTNLNAISEWANIPEEVHISNVEKMPFMYIKSPIDNRKETDNYGVPITYGCDKLIIDILSTLGQINREFDLKEAFVGADSTMFNGEGALPKNGLFRKINAGEDSFFEIFSPEIRESSYYTKLLNQCALLEKQVGTSRGILTERESTNATATEIRASMKDTFDLIDDIRNVLVEGLKDFLYACDVLANYYNLVPSGNYELKTDWDYSLIEDTQNTFNQLIQGKNLGVIKDVELRQFIKPDETVEEAEQAINDIKEKEPNIKDLIGE